MTAAGSRAALHDALAIVDFITIFGASFEAAPLSLLEVQQMAGYPLDTNHLAQFYIALLRCLLIEAVSPPLELKFVCIPAPVALASSRNTVGDVIVPRVVFTNHTACRCKFFSHWPVLFKIAQWDYRARAGSFSIGMVSCLLAHLREVLGADQI